MIKMKALRSFGVPGSNEGKVKRGRELQAAHEQRAKDLEEAGLAYRLESKMESAPLNKMEPAPSNKAATSGPLGSPGGMTGEVEPVPSSLQDPPRRPRRSARSKDEDLLS